MTLIETLLISVGINLAIFIPAYLLKTDKFTDISYSITFILLTIFGYLSSPMNLNHTVLLLLVIIWAARLGTYLFIRIHKMKRDKRFDEMRESFTSFLGFWLLQGFTVWAVMIPSTLYFDNITAEISLLSYLGVFVWALGLIIESVADFQKYKFKNNPKNKGKWIESGLWKYSRHPNYFGEITLWLGVYLYTLPGLIGLEKLLGVVGPTYIAILILFVSGIPLLEKKAEKKWGDNKNYREYKEETNLLIPLPKIK